MATASQQAPSPAPQHQDNVPENSTPSVSTNTLFSTTNAKTVFFLIASAICQVLAARTWLALSSSKPWWLADAASLTIRAQGAELVNKTDVKGGGLALLHVISLGLGRGLDNIFLEIYGGV